VAVQPAQASEGRARNRLMAALLATINIIVATMGTATMPLMTAVHTSGGQPSAKSQKSGLARLDQHFRVLYDVAFAQFDRRWARRAEPGGGFGLFFFGRFARE
jgi:hypothetical protein